MKTLLATIVAAAFCLATSAQAGEKADAAKAKASTCADQAKSGCCAEKTACCASAKVAKKADTSVKGATLLIAKR